MRLRSDGPRLKPKQPNGDICMPPIQTSWNGALNNPSKQEPSTKDFKQSCSFDDARITEYERANTNFKKQIYDKAAPGICKAFSDLLIMDIAYLASSSVNWEPEPAAALSAGKAAADDDDDAAILPHIFNICKWDISNMESIPWKALLQAVPDHRAARGLDVVDLSPPVLAAGFIAHRMDRNPDMELFYSTVTEYHEKSTGEKIDGLYGRSKNIKAWATRASHKFTSEEEKFLRAISETTFKDPGPGSDTDTDDELPEQRSLRQRKPAAAPQAAPQAARAPQQAAPSTGASSTGGNPAGGPAVGSRRKAVAAVRPVAAAVRPIASPRNVRVVIGKSKPKRTRETGLDETEDHQHDLHAVPVSGLTGRALAGQVCDNEPLYH